MIISTSSCPTVFFNDRLLPKAESLVSVDTPAFKYGAMVFEGIRAYWNETQEQLFVFRLGDHCARLEDSVRIMRMETDLTATDFSAAVVKVLEANSVKENVHIRQMVWVDGSGQMYETHPVSHAVIVSPKGSWFEQEGIHVCTSSWKRISDDSMPPRVKCAANYQNGRLALLEARVNGYDGAILLNGAGKIAEEARGCVFFRRDDKIITPKLTSGILESITRATLIRLFNQLYNIDVVEREVDRTELYIAREVFICGSGLEVTSVASIDRHTIGDGKAGEMTENIRRDYLRAVRRELPQYEDWLTPVYKRDA